ncbi:hypothetical protein WJ96_07575 [Burkholderia ubonensis]|uniref:DNA topoisomerase type IA zn finger domain-containing protein n=1 Tax=Burkholderia ubonensis TaxID=101571 RepID=A0AAW3MTU0_9BURK|nr:hypothetical protein [Burkholderia ubonensis]KVP75559.1 hypothetical protein WJ93_09375 [Burkholderia ubonensis]KVP98371.1 hypothetical protein WJ96_07575 [Burkholderia ubonensis]KVZ93070.1 hypothetical protein WL25_19240 [Burkholderia ubonensis]
MSSSAPLALSRRRSQLRWRLSYLALSLLVFWVAKAAILVVLALRVDGAPGVVLSELADLLSPYRTSVRNGLYWLTAATTGVMALTAVQIYFVGGRPKGRNSSKRCPECEGRLRRHTITRGKVSGQSFLACEHHPACGYSSRRR